MNFTDFLKLFLINVEKNTKTEVHVLFMLQHVMYCNTKDLK